MEKLLVQNFQNWQENTCAKVSFLKKVADFRPLTCNFIKKETLEQMFSCKFCKICKNIFFSRTSLGAASIYPQNI